MTSTLAIFGGNIGATEIIVILAICLLLFGANKLPKLARSLGSSMTEFKKGLRGEPSPAVAGQCRPSQCAVAWIGETPHRAPGKE